MRHQKDMYSQNIRLHRIHLHTFFYISIFRQYKMVQANFLNISELLHLVCMKKNYYLVAKYFYLLLH